MEDNAGLACSINPSNGAKPIITLWTNRREGIDLATVKELMGYTTMNMTMRNSHLSPDHRKNAIEKFATISTTNEQKIHTYK